MKVYLVHCKYYDYNECTFGSLLLGVYSSMDLAIIARDNFVEAELAEASGPNCPAQKSIDADGNPIVAKFFDGEVAEDSTFTIEEWTVQ